MRIGLVLSGGAARGFAHLGVLKALDELHIKIDIISGTSSGAMAGALYSAGYSPEDAFKLVTDTNILRLMRPAFSRFGLMRLEEVEKALIRYLGDKTFEDLSPRLIVCATDINRGVLVYFSEGQLVKPLLASFSVPILYKPIHYQDRFLIDGGLLSNLPVECITGESDFIIGVHTNPMDHERDVSSFRGLLERTIHLAINNNVEPRMKLCNFMIEPPEMKQYSLLEISKAKEIFESGYNHTMHLADNLLARIEEVKATLNP